MTGFYGDKVKIRKALFFQNRKKSSANISAPKNVA